MIREEGPRFWLCVLGMFCAAIVGGAVGEALKSGGFPLVYQAAGAMVGLILMSVIVAAVVITVPVPVLNEWGEPVS